MPVLSIAEVVRAAVARPAPLLCVDTCSVLDVAREPHRPHQTGRCIAACRTITNASSSATAYVIVAPTVPTELQRNRQTVFDELAKSIEVIEDGTRRVLDAISDSGLGISGGRVPLTALNLPASLGAVIDALGASWIQLVEDPAANDRAFRRAVQLIAPSRKGEVLDAQIVEHYLGLGSALRSAGFTSPIVMVSSNTADYGRPGNIKPPLDADFSSIGLRFTTDFAWAVRELGL